MSHRSSGERGPGMGKIQVLLLDDEEEYRKALSQRMTFSDFQSGVALSGEEALEYLEDAPPDVMVLDLRMPGGRGMEILERIRTDHPDVQVIVLTERDETGMDAGESCADADLGIPVNTSQLVNTVRRAWAFAREAIKEGKEEFQRHMAAQSEGLGTGYQPRGNEPIGDPVPPEAIPSGGLKVLLVDDEEAYVRTVAERLEARDLGANVAFSGEEALAVLPDNLPDVIVLDLKMPGMGGMAFLKLVKRDYPGIEVIILTGHGSRKEREEAMRLGAFDYLEKPVDIRLLMARVRRAGSVTDSSKHEGGKP